MKKENDHWQRQTIVNTLRSNMEQNKTTNNEDQREHMELSFQSKQYDIRENN